jgi:hypothetical protein
LLGIGKRKAKEAVEEVVEEAIEEVTELVGEKLRDIFGTYVIERRTSEGEAVRRYEDGSVRIGKRQVKGAD